MILRKIDCYSVYRGYRKVRLKLIVMKEKLDFLLKYKNLDIIPKFLSFKVPTNGALNLRHVHRFQMKLLRTEIHKTRMLLADQQKKLNFCQNMYK